jgi:hypothetical protein
MPAVALNVSVPFKEPNPRVYWMLVSLSMGATFSDQWGLAQRLRRESTARGRERVRRFSGYPREPRNADREGFEREESPYRRCDHLWSV